MDNKEEILKTLIVLPKKLISKNTNVRAIGIIKKDELFNKFIVWSSMSKGERPHGLKTHREFAGIYGLSKNTLVLWKQREEYWPAILRARKIYFGGFSSNILWGLQKRAIKGEVEAAKLWMQIVEGWAEIKNFKPKNI